MRKTQGWLLEMEYQKKGIASKISKEVLEKALKKMKNNKETGPDLKLEKIWDKKVGKCCETFLGIQSNLFKKIY